MYTEFWKKIIPLRVPNSKKCKFYLRNYKFINMLIQGIFINTVYLWTSQLFVVGDIKKDMA